MSETIDDIGIKYEDFIDIIWENRDNLKTDEQRRIWDTTGDGTKVILDKDLRTALIKRCKELKEERNALPAEKFTYMREGIRMTIEELMRFGNLKEEDFEELTKKRS